MALAPPRGTLAGEWDSPRCHLTGSWAVFGRKAMLHDYSLDSLVERICRQWEAKRRSQQARATSSAELPPRFTIAVERQAGVLGTSIARAVGQRLGWQVYDHELLERIAQEMGLRATLLESVDEHHASWLREVSHHLMLLPSINENAYLQHLVGVVLALGAHGECIIVGRGASEILPPETTLRVFLIAPKEARLATIR